jgi:ribosomal protein S3AE
MRDLYGMGEYISSVEIIPLNETEIKSIEVLKKPKIAEKTRKVHQIFFF